MPGTCQCQNIYTHSQAIAREESSTNNDKSRRKHECMGPHQSILFVHAGLARKKKVYSLIGLKF
jgi:hypothetical protein